jgi:hypothetical protein
MTPDGNLGCSWVLALFALAGAVMIAMAALGFWQGESG